MRRFKDKVSTTIFNPSHANEMVYQDFNFVYYFIFGIIVLLFPFTFWFATVSITDSSIAYGDIFPLVMWLLIAVGVNLILITFQLSKATFILLNIVVSNLSTWLVLLFFHVTQNHLPINSILILFGFLVTTYMLFMFIGLNQSKLENSLGLYIGYFGVLGFLYMNLYEWFILQAPFNFVFHIAGILFLVIVVGSISSLLLITCLQMIEKYRIKE